MDNISNAIDKAINKLVWCSSCSKASTCKDCSKNGGNKLACTQGKK